jgi:hypothetical protein
MIRYPIPRGCTPIERVDETVMMDVTNAYD